MVGWGRGDAAAQAARRRKAAIKGTVADLALDKQILQDVLSVSAADFGDDLLTPMQQYVAWFLATFKEFPPSQLHHRSSAGVAELAGQPLIGRRFEDSRRAPNPICEWNRSFPSSASGGGDDVAR
jgi:hypothetical protein